MTSEAATIRFKALSCAVVLLWSLSAAPPETSSAQVGGSVIDKASYAVAPETGGPDSRYVTTLRNEGTSTIEYGNPYGIARRTPSGWQRLQHSGRCAWTLELRILRPGDSDRQRVAWMGRRCQPRTLRPGSYRVGKTIWFTTTGSDERRRDRVRAFFQVVDR